jgi:hypothetical protein
VQKKNREWWECTNRACRHKIEFLMLNVGRDKASPACFCGSAMKRAYAKPGYNKGAGALVTKSSGVRAATVLFSCSFYFLS